MDKCFGRLWRSDITPNTRKSTENQKIRQISENLDEVPVDTIIAVIFQCQEKELPKKFQDWSNISLPCQRGGRSQRGGPGPGWW